MAVYDRVKEVIEEEIDEEKRYKQVLITAWRNKDAPKTWLIKEMLRSLIKDIQIWWEIRQLKKVGYIGYRKED